MDKYSRRDLIKNASIMALAPAVVSTLAPNMVVAQQVGASFNPVHQPRPLPYPAGSLKNLSEKLIQSHWQNNYGGSVRALNVIKRRLSDAMSTDDVPAFVYNDLKREHLMRTGSVVLHELYFENMGGNGKAGGDIRRKLSASFGSFDAWETEYRKIGAGLGGGSGWVMLALNQHTGMLENYWLADHTNSPPYSIPLLVMDMYEHSYHMDYGTATARYIDAFFENINWEIASRRLDSVSA